MSPVRMTSPTEMDEALDGHRHVSRMYVIFLQLYVIHVIVYEINISRLTQLRHTIIWFCSH